MAFHLYSGCRLEYLAEEFAKLYAEPPLGRGALEPEVAAVQSQGTGTWLKQYLAANTPVAANLEMPFVRKFIDSVFAGAFRGFAPKELASQLNRMPWRIFEFLSNRHNLALCPEAAGYLADDPFLLKRYQLSMRLTGLFDQYQIYRPELLTSWRRPGFDPSGNWQARVYTALFGGEKTFDRYFVDFFALDRLPEGACPSRISVFGISTMPPLFLRFFLKLAEFSEVHFFYLTPSAAYWGETRTPAELQRMRLPYEELEAVREEQNPLLASLGRSGREFFTTLLSEQENAEFIETDLAPPEEPDPPKLLESLQYDIIHNLNRSEPLEVAENDDSVAIHNCHTPLREVEVLHDELLRLIGRDGLQPRDIVVATPAPAVYAPLIQAVFDAGPLCGRYSISDRTLLESGTLVNCFFELISMPRGRFTFSGMEKLVENQAIRSRFGLGSDAADYFTRWFREAGARWGIDADDRERVCGERFDDFSWSLALNRLLAGYALPENPAAQSDLAVIPLDAAEGTDAEILGRFAALLKAVFSLRARLAGRRTVSQWCEVFAAVAAEFFDPGSDGFDEFAALNGAIDALRKNAAAAGCFEPVPADVPAAFLTERCSQTGGGAAFLRGKITFCTLLPLRSIPAQAVAILGLSDGKFPRRDLEPGFNLMSREIRPCDRSKPLEDRFMFLEAILAARRKLMLFYCGQDARGDGELPPAAPLGELRDVLNRSFKRPSGTGFEVKHRLQAFDFAYFDNSDPRKFSYSLENYDAAAALAGVLRNGEQAVRDKAALRRTLAEIAGSRELPQEVSVEDFIGFFVRPVAYFLAENANLPLRNRRESPPPDDDPEIPDALDSYLISENIASLIAEGVDKSAQYDILRKTAMLPVGENGREAFETRYAMMAELPDEYWDFRHTRRQADIRLRAGGIAIAGSLEISEDGRTAIHCRPAGFKGKDAVRSYLAHLMLNASGFAVKTSIYFREGKRIAGRELAPLEPGAALAELDSLAEFYLRGRREPLPLFMNASYEYAAAAPEKRNNAALTAFARAGDFGPPGDMSDPDEPGIGMLFSEEDFNLPPFEELAMLVFKPFAGGGKK
ncbi:MAG: exodeoxyribonuclease V subunit gamma [Victivallaceae bacterium]|nr:exodeoxyribonuclease V subunit gamma [Victivallaceae bacterium]